MENNTVTPSNPEIPPVVTTPQTVQPVEPQISVTSTPQLTSAPEPKPKSNIKSILIIVGLVILFIVIGFYLIGKNINKNVDPEIVVTTSENNGKKVTNIQYNDQTQKILTNSCFSTVIPKSAQVRGAETGDDCTFTVVMPDTTIPFVTVIAIDENDKSDIKEVVYAHDAEYKRINEEANRKYESKISENVNFGGFNTYILNYYDGSNNKASYYIDVPLNTGYKVNDLSVRAFFMNGYANDPSMDVFSKYYKDFVTNIEFK